MKNKKQKSLHNQNDKVSHPSAISNADSVLSFDNDADTPLLNIGEVAEYLNVSVPSVRRLQQRRLITFVKVGGCIRFAKHDLVSYLEKMRIGAIG
jgi:excisionase family DNA binding protein